MGRFILTVVLTVAFATAAFSQEIHSKHCLHGCPLGGSPSDDLIVREIYVLRTNDLTKFAVWAAYRVRKQTIGPSRARNWRTDPVLEARETLEPNDYIGANAALHVDRGHQVPLASVTGTPQWPETNYLSNITPQRSDLNQGPWARLETAERALALAPGIDGVYVQTGPLFERPMRPLPNADEGHVVPSGYWKIVAISDGNAMKIAAFILDQEAPRNANFCERQSTIQEVEMQTGLTFFHNYRGRFSPLASALGC